MSHPHVRGSRSRRLPHRRRRRRGVVARHPVALAFLVVPVAIGIGGLVTVAVMSLFMLVMVLSLVVPVALIATLVVVLSRARRRPRAVPTRTEPAVDWAGARHRFDALRGAYAAHECDPMAVLRRPALSDVRVPSTGLFVAAFARAQALQTDAPPAPAQAAAFAAAVEQAQRAWSAAVDAADRIRLSSLSPGERATVERVLKLLTTARDSDSDAERLAAYSRARSELDKLDRSGVVHLPRPARAVLDRAARGELPG